MKRGVRQQREDSSLTEAFFSLADDIYCRIRLARLAAKSPKKVRGN